MKLTDQDKELLRRARDGRDCYPIHREEALDYMILQREGYCTVEKPREPHPEGVQVKPLCFVTLTDQGAQAISQGAACDLCGEYGHALNDEDLCNGCRAIVSMTRRNDRQHLIWQLASCRREMSVSNLFRVMDKVGQRVIDQCNEVTRMHLVNEIDIAVGYLEHHGHRPHIRHRCERRLRKHVDHLRRLMAKPSSHAEPRETQPDRGYRVGDPHGDRRAPYNEWGFE